jgi:predicted sulfurtransferase
MGKIALFYKYVKIEYPKQILKWQQKLCEKLNLTGRILLAHEGINGTIAGSDEQIDGYIKALQKHELFKDIDFKINPGEKNFFPKMRIAIREEIVTLGVGADKAKIENTGVHLTPEETHNFINKNKELVILDTRNTYESKIGAFRGAILPNIENFRDFPGYIDANQELFKDKEVLMYCTGGVRCERATAYLKEKNIAKEVYHILGGIQRYTESFPDGHFRGKNYVFDGRVSVRINNDIVGLCDVCSVKNDDITNCINVRCNKQFIACPQCLISLENTCSTSCHTLIKNKEVAIRIKPKKVNNNAQQHPTTSCSF